jgi:hypothetical protein
MPANDSMDAIELAAFDDALPRSSDPPVWTANLEALRTEQPEFARELEHTALPPHWRPVVALDGFPTYRVEPRDEAARWLAATAAPATRAAALLAKLPASSTNLALPAIAAGAELSFLLGRLSHQRAVFVFEQDPARWVAVLRTIDIAEAIASGRCVLIPPGAEQSLLEELLERHPGLLPPGTIVAPQLCDPARLVQLRKMCEMVAQHTNEARLRRLKGLKPRAPLETSGEALHPRLAVLALGPDAASHRLAAQLTAAATTLGWNACQRTASSPRDVHALPHYEALVDFGAGLVICVDHAPGTLPLPPGTPVCYWHLHTRDVPAGMPADDTVHLAATPRVADTLRAAGVPSERLLDFHWACPATNGGEPAPRAGHQRQSKLPNSIILVGDQPDASAAACGIVQPTHKQLWKQLHQTAIRAWETSEITQPATLLRDAERASGITLGERSLYERLVRIIEHVLIPAVVLETILCLLRRESYEVLTVGRGWHRCSNDTLQQSVESIDDLVAQSPDMPVTAAVFAGPLDPLTPALLLAAALGWPLLIHSPGKTALTSQLGGILHPRQHYEPFAGSRDLCATLDAIRSDPTPVQRRCERVREHMFMRHTYAHRLTAVARQLGLEWPGIRS